MAEKAIEQDPRDYKLSKMELKKFKECFAVDWADAISTEIVFNASGAKAELNISNNTLSKLWNESRQCFRISRHFHVAVIAIPRGPRGKGSDGSIDGECEAFIDDDDDEVADDGDDYNDNGRSAKKARPTPSTLHDYVNQLMDYYEATASDLQVAEEGKDDSTFADVSHSPTDEGTPIESHSSHKPPKRSFILVVNGFYSNLKRQYINPEICISFMVIEFDGKKFPWSTFLTKVLGDKDPSKALPSSIRGTLYEDWRHWNLDQQPSLLDNCLHVSASVSLVLMACILI